jgi:hypothetical protein
VDLCLDQGRECRLNGVVMTNQTGAVTVAVVPGPAACGQHGGSAGGAITVRISCATSRRCVLANWF